MKIFDPKLTGSIAFENAVQGNFEITGDLVVPGSITAREFKTEFVSASIIYQSGSTQFGNSSDDTHVFTGSAFFEPGLTVTGDGTNHIIKAVRAGTTRLFVGNAVNTVGINTETVNNPLTVNGSADFSGNVGINITTPSYRLDVGGGSGFRDTLRVLANDVNVVNLSWTATNTGLVNLYDGGNLTTQIISNGTSYFNGGNVGIGTVNADTKLQVNVGGNGIRHYSDSNNILTTYVGSNYQIFEASNNGVTSQFGYGLGNFYIQTAGSRALTISTVGEVGIGTSNPFRKLVISNGGANGIELDPNISGLSEIISYNRSTESYTPLHLEASRFALLNGNVGIANTSPTDYSGYKMLHIGDGTVGNTGIIKLGTGSTANGPEIYAATVGGVNRLLLNTNATTNVMVLNGSNVGVGTDSPSKTLDVNGAIRSRNSFNLSDGTTQVGGLFKHKVVTGAGTDNSGVLFSETGLDLHFMTNGSVSSKMIINTNGNVGIGTTVAAYPLHIYDVDDSPLLVEGANAWSGVKYKDSNGEDFMWFYGGTQTFAFGGGGSSTQSNKKMHIAGATTIGLDINQAAVPDESLYVQGSVRSKTVEYNWYQVPHITSASTFTHLKTTLYAGAGNNIMHIMGGFTFKGYKYASNGYGEGSVMFHNWSGVLFNLSVTNRGDWSTFVRSPYVSSDGYVVLVFEHNDYSQPLIDFYQFFTPYDWRTVTVSAYSTSNNLTGVY